jgi:aryl-alcohol dehydrogenase-like predicted oxidoreductase
MKYRALGNTGFNVSILSYGASALGNVYRKIDDREGIDCVHLALEHGINYIDVSPAYGGTKAEKVLGQALKGIPRDQYLLSTKVGKYCAFDSYGDDIFDYSQEKITSSLQESMERLGVDYFDMVYLHDIEYHQRRHVQQALGEGLETLREHQHQGIIRKIGVSTYPTDLWHQVADTTNPDILMTHNHYCLNDDFLLELIPKCEAKGWGLINSSPLACGLLTERGAPSWHPATEKHRNIVQKAIELCHSAGTSLEQLAMQFSVSNPQIPTTLTTSASKERLLKSIQAVEATMDTSLLVEVQNSLAPLKNIDWNFGELC